MAFKEFVVSLQRLGGEIPSRRCISFYFALYRSDVGNLIGNSSNEKQREDQEWHSRQHCSYAHAYGVAHSYMLAGVPIPTSAPLVKCIRMATPFFLSFKVMSNLKQ